MPNIPRISLKNLEAKDLDTIKELKPKFLIRYSPNKNMRKEESASTLSPLSAFTLNRNDNFNNIKKYQMLPFFLKDFNHPLIILIDKLKDDDRIIGEINECITTIQEKNSEFHPTIYWINGLFQPDNDRILENSINHRKLKDFLKNGTFFQNAHQKFTENNLFLCNYARFWGGRSAEIQMGNRIPKSLQMIISKSRQCIRPHRTLTQ